jgi:endonuclease YncB( thermonuclease family)
VDGDTFYMTGQDVRIRVWGLDAPEVDTFGGKCNADHLLPFLI